MWKRWLDRLQSPQVESHPPRDVATAVLLLECARADYEHAPVELDTVREALRDAFALDETELEQLIGDAGRSARESVSLHGPLSRLNAELSSDDKRGLIQWLWRVAAADGRIDAHEEHLLRKLADLLHVPHADFIRGKFAALDGDS